MSTNAEQVGASPNVAHDYLSLHVQVKQKGYLYVYLSNENPVMANVYFDDFKITHHTGIEQSDDYYAFGLTFNSYQRENTTANQYLYNGKEKQDELDLGWLDYGARMYEGTIGRWMVADPLTEKYTGLSPYNYVANSPTNVTDKDGRDWEWQWQRDKNNEIIGLNLKFTGKILDRTEGYTDEQLAKLKDTFVKGVESMLKGNYSKLKISTEINLSVAKDISEVRDEDHLINIISDKDLAEARGSDVNGNAEVGELNIWLNQRSVNETLRSGSVRDVAHEIGHTGG